MKLFSVAPYDQNLSLRGVMLKGEGSQTLASLNVLPGDTIYLKVSHRLTETNRH